MAFRHGKNTVVLYNGFNLSSYFNEASVSQKVDTAETTAFGNDAKTYITGQQDGTISLKGMFDGSASAIDVTLSGVIGAASPDVITVAPDGVVSGRRVFFGKAHETSYEISAPVSDVVSATAEVQVTGGANAGNFLDVLSSVSASGQSAALDNGSSSSNGGVGVLHVTANNRDGASTFTVQHSSDNVSFVDLVTFASVAASAIGGEQVSVTGTVNQYVRAAYTPGGSSGSVTYTMAFSRK